MPNLASRNHSGTWYFSSDPREPSNGPFWISTPAGAAAARLRNIAGAPANSPIAFRLVSFIGALIVSGLNGVSQVEASRIGAPPRQVSMNVGSVRRTQLAATLARETQQLCAVFPANLTEDFRC